MSAFIDMLLLLLLSFAPATDLELSCRWERKFYLGGGKPMVSHTQIDIRTKGKSLNGRIDGAGFRDDLDGTVSGNKLRFTTGTKGTRLFAEWELTHTPGKGGGQLTGRYRYPDGIIGEVTAECGNAPPR